ncbi:hypothetical protein [Roseomonas mucosa]|nr:hypothetical protein [Roseomonas mucosa]UZO94613.1 Hypothetical protein RMP42_05886 [Roseomonas mucosa]
MTPVHRPPDRSHAPARPLGPFRRLLEAPGANVAVFAFLLNYPWEFLQVPLFRGMPTASHWEAIKVCTSATLGDTVIAVVAFWGVAAAAGTRRWILAPSAGQLAGFVAIGVAITLVLEWLATGPLGRWEYAEAMPIVPLLGVGLSPVLQWILLPPLVAWFVRRQLT